MGPPGSTTRQTYDIIFCRNLLIYQHTAARAQIITTLDRLLKPEGLLFVGHAEMMPLLADLYAPVSHRGAFAYCKTNIRSKMKARWPNQSTVDGTDGNGSEQVAPTKALPAEAITKILPTTTSPARIQDNPGAAEIHFPAPAAATRLELVRALADQGRLDEAAASCRELLKTNPRLVEAHFLMGIIETATGQVNAAEECLNRALYLDANYYEALMHLSLLKARRGDEAGAERLRQRAERVLGQTKVTT